MKQAELVLKLYYHSTPGQTRYSIGFALLGGLLSPINPHSSVYLEKRLDSGFPTFPILRDEILIAPFYPFFWGGGNIRKVGDNKRSMSNIAVEWRVFLPGPAESSLGSWWEAPEAAVEERTDLYICVTEDIGVKKRVRRAL